MKTAKIIIYPLIKLLIFYQRFHSTLINTLLSQDLSPITYEVSIIRKNKSSGLEIYSHKLTYSIKSILTARIPPEVYFLLINIIISFTKFKDVKIVNSQINIYT